MASKKSTARGTKSKMSPPPPKSSVSIEKPSSRLNTTMAILSTVFVVAVAVFFSGHWASVGVQGAGIQADLKPLLSANASITLPDSTNFKDLTARWSQYDAPNVNVVVTVATEQDILYANAHNVSFLAYSGGHGAISSLAKVTNGIEISMRQMNRVTIAPDGQRVTIGGGAMVKEVTQALSAAGKRTVTGVCECVGSVAPMLGGGHGLLQGQYGLLADQLISARVVLGNGTVVTVSTTSHADLFWAIRGAGHNFGIVTEYTLRIYDAQPDDMWGFEQFIFAGTQLEQLYTTVNTMKKSQPAQVVEWGFITRMPALDPVNPVIIYTIICDGPSSVSKNYSAPIRSLSALQTDSREVPYLAIPGLTGNGENDIACQKGANLLRFPIYLESYNVTALQQVYDAFNQMMVQQPAFNNSFFLVEGYSVQGVQKVPADSTAFPHRGDNMLLTPAVVYLPDSTLDAAAVEHGQHFRELLLQGSGRTELNAYVNYAHGDESLGSMYGSEPWRLERLRKLKTLYDPGEKFSFYAPIHEGKEGAK